MVERRDFEKLGKISDVIPVALDTATQTSWTVNTRLKRATAITRQLRCRHELLLEERPEANDGPARMKIDGIPVEPLGDDVLRAEPTEVLDILHHRLHSYAAVDKRMDDKGWSKLRSIYGYDGESWTQRSHSLGPPRRDLRVAICLAADAAFAPFAFGVLEAIALRQATLRIDVHSISTAIWAWANDYPALARSLWVSRLAQSGEAIDFPAFTSLYGRVLRDHQETGFDEPGRTEEIAAVANTLGQRATASLESAGGVGRTSARITIPVIEALARTHPQWIPDEPEEDAEEVFARGASQLLIETLTGRRDAESTVAALEALGQAVGTAKRKGRRDA